MFKICTRVNKIITGSAVLNIEKDTYTYFLLKIQSKSLVAFYHTCSINIYIFDFLFNFIWFYSIITIFFIYHKFHLIFILQYNTSIIPTLFIKYFKYHYSFNTIFIKIGKVCHYVIHNFFLHNPFWTIHK